MEKEKDLLKSEEMENDTEFSIEMEYNIVKDEEETFDIDVKLQECYVKLDQLDIKLAAYDYTDEEYEEYVKLKKEIKELRKQKKQINNEKNEKREKNIFELVPLWIYIYGGIMLFLNLPWIAEIVWFKFSVWLIEVVPLFSKISMDDGALYYVWFFILAFAIPLLLHVLSWEMYVNFANTKIKKRAFAIAWIIQALLTIGMILYFIFEVRLFG